MDEAKKDAPEVKAEPVKDAPVPAPAPSPAPAPMPAPTKESKWQEVLAVVEEVLQIAAPLIPEILHVRAAKTAEQLQPLAEKLKKLQAVHAKSK